MRFRTLLIHRCSLLTQGQVTGTDDYGRDIISKIESFNVPCRVDNIRERNVTDDTGTDLVMELLLFFDEDYGITYGTEVHSIVDKEGNPVLPGSFSVQSIMPIYDRSKLHHYEVTMRRT